MSNPVKDAMSGAYYYESKTVKRTRSSKYCAFCEETIPSGSAHDGAMIFDGEFRAIAWCDSCKSKYPSEISALKNAEYDSY